MKIYVRVNNKNELNAIVAIVGLDYDLEYEIIGDIFYLEELSKPKFIEISITDEYKVVKVVTEVEVPSTLYSFIDFMKNYKEIIDSVTVEK